MAFAVAAAAEQYKRENERWEQLADLISDHGEVICETIADAMSM